MGQKSSSHLLDNNTNLETITKTNLETETKSALHLEQLIEKNTVHWKYYIINKLDQNLNLFAEFELTSWDNTYHNNPVMFKSGHKLKEIEKKELLQLIKIVMETNFKNKQYIISTRSKDDTSHYYIVVSIMQNNYINNDSTEQNVNNDSTAQNVNNDSTTQNKNSSAVTNGFIKLRPVPQKFIEFYESYLKNDSEFKENFSTFDPNMLTARTEITKIIYYYMRKNNLFELNNNGTYNERIILPDNALKELFSIDNNDVFFVNEGIKFNNFQSYIQRIYQN